MTFAVPSRPLDQFASGVLIAALLSSLSACDCDGEGPAPLECEAGSFAALDADAGPRCVPFRDCLPGHYVESEGDVSRDRECAPCAEGAFSDMTNAAACAPWTVCEEGTFEALAGTRTADRVCAPREWVRVFDLGASGDHADTVAADGTGGAFVGGFISIEREPDRYTHDAFVRRYDSSGEVVWTQRLDTPETDRVSGLSVDPSGNVVMVGNNTGAIYNDSPPGDSAGFVHKYDAAGGLIWTREIDTPEVEQATAVAVDGSGNIFVAGRTFGTLEEGILGSTVDAFLRKYDPDGNVVWTRQLDHDSGTSARGLSVDASGNVFLVGELRGDLAGVWQGGDDVYVRVYDGDGTELWTRQFGTPEYDYATGVAVGSSGAVFVVGYSHGNLSGLEGEAVGGFLRTYNSSGVELWTQSGIGASAYAVSVDARDHAVVAGLGGAELLGTDADGAGDAFARAFDADGGIVWTRSVGSNHPDYALGVSAGDRGEVFVAGYTGGVIEGMGEAGRLCGFLWRFEP